jgi:hemin uptake protein HemP
MNAKRGQDPGQDSYGAIPPSGPATRTIKLAGSRIDSGDLFVGTREIIIRHRDDNYRLRLTAQNKLILTK